MKSITRLKTRPEQHAEVLNNYVLGYARARHYIDNPVLLQAVITKLVQEMRYAKYRPVKSGPRTS